MRVGGESELSLILPLTYHPVPLVFISRKRHNWNKQSKVQGNSAVGFEKKYSLGEKYSFFPSEIQVGFNTIYSLASVGDYLRGCNIKKTFYCK